MRLALRVVSHQPLVSLLDAGGRAHAVGVGAAIGSIHPLGHFVLQDERFGPAHLEGGADGVLGGAPSDAVLGQERLDLLDEDLLGLNPSRGIVAPRPVAVQVVEELPGEQIPNDLRQDVVEELAHGVVHLAILGKEPARRLGCVKLVVIGLCEDAVEHVFEDFGSVQVVALDVLALAALEALLEGNHQKAAVQRLRLVAKLRQRVDALNHEASELHRARVFELAVHQERVSRDDGLERRRIVQVGARVVLVGDDGGDAREGFELEVIRERLDGDGRPRPLAAEVAGEGAKRPLAVVAEGRVQPRALVPVDIGAHDRTENLPKKLHDLGVIGKLVHPRHHVPVGAVLVVADDGIGSVFHEVRPDFGGEHQPGVEVHENLVAIVVQAVVHGDEVGVGAGRHHLAHRAQDRNDLIDVTFADRCVIAADKSREVVASGVVDALGIPLRLVHAHVVVSVPFVCRPADELGVVDLLDGKRNLEGQKLLELLEALARRLLVGVGVLHLCSHGGIGVARAKVILLYGVVGGLEQLAFDGRRRRGAVRIDARKIVFGHGSYKLVIRLFHGFFSESFAVFLECFTVTFGD